MFPVSHNELKQLNNRAFKKVFLALLLLNSPTQVVCYQGYVFNILVTNSMLKKWS